MGGGGLEKGRGGEQPKQRGGGGEDRISFPGDTDIWQGAAVWQWWNCASAALPAGRTFLRLNLDETSICLYQGGNKGTVFFKKRQHDPDTEPVQHANLAKRRCCFTHVGLICDKPDLQPVLPQVLIANESTFSAGDMAALEAECPENVHLVRQKSAWNNVEVCKETIRLLAKALEPHLASKGLQPVLLLDAAPIHLAPSFFQCCVANGIWPIIIPARCTWLLQPLDTHVFRQYKMRLRARYQIRRLETANGQLTMAQFLPVVYDSIRQVLEGRRWAAAFDQDGFGQSQRALSAFVLRQCQLEGPPSVPALLPTLEVLERCWPRNREVKSGWLLRPYRQAALLAPAPAPAPLALPAAQPSGQATHQGPRPQMPRGRLLTPGRLPPPPLSAALAVAPATANVPVTRLQAALAKGASSSSSRPGKADRGLRKAE